MPWFYTIATVERRARAPILLKDITGRKKFGTMNYNGNGQHEIEMTEERYLEIAPDLAKLSRLPGAGVYVSKIRDARAPEVIEFEAGYNLAMDGQPLPDIASEATKAGHNIVVWRMATETHRAGTGVENAEIASSVLGIPVEDVMQAAELHRWQDAPPAVDAKMNWLKLKKIAKDEGANIEGLTTSAAIAEAILAHRGNLTPA